MKELRFGIIGAGFWANYQLAAWKEVPGVRCVAVANRTLSRAEELARQQGIGASYDDAEEMLAREELDFVDVITNVETHAQFVRLAAKHRTPVICQKPLAASLKQAREMVNVCEKAGVPLLVHENWRWQTPIQAVKRVLERGEIGRVFRARVDMISGFPVFKNQPFLAELPQFILTDMGSHILDTARFLFGEASRLYCQTAKVHKQIKGEDVATVVLQTQAGATVVCEMAYAENFLERERFPETFIFVEGEKGSVELGPDFWVKVTTSKGTFSKRHVPPRYPWADAAYDLVHASIVDCHRDLLKTLRGQGSAQTTGADNLRTVEFVFASYDSAKTGNAVRLTQQTKP